MSYFQAKFSNAPANMPDARQTQNFINNLQNQERERKDKAKALGEDQKRLSMLAQGYGLEKGEADSMSRGELQGFVEQQALQTAKQKQQQDQILNLAKFQNQMQQTDINRQMAQSQSRMADANIANAKAKQDQLRLERFLRSKDAEIVRGDIAKNLTNKSSEDPNLRGQAQQFLQKTGFNENSPLMSDSRLLEQHRAGMSKSPNIPGDELQMYQDKEMIKDMQGFDVITAQSNMQKLKTAKDKLAQAMRSGKKITGTAVSFLPDFLRNIVDEEGMFIQSEVESVIQMNLKATLGGAFSEKEGRQFLARGFSPQLNDPANYEKLMNLYNDLEKRIVEQQSKYDYLQQRRGPYGNMTFNGWRPPSLPSSDGNSTKAYDQTTGSGNRVNINIPGSTLKQK